MRSIFGWSYPPGCSGPPDQDEEPCEVCGLDVDDCVCPECPVCGGYGDPSCYIVTLDRWRYRNRGNHGLVRNEEQKFNKEIYDRWCFEEYTSMKEVEEDFYRDLYE